MSNDPKFNYNPTVKVIGVGGGGCNTVDRMIQAGIKDVNYVQINTDVKSLNNGKAENKIILGEGLGAGEDPLVGEKLAEEAVEYIRNIFDKNTKVVFITTGLGGGTGTGATPVVARLAREAEILTIGIVTLPFTSEGEDKTLKAKEGVRKLESLVNCLMVIPNDRIVELDYLDIPLLSAFLKIDEVIMNSVRSVNEIMFRTGVINRDFRDINTVLSNSGKAFMGIGVGKGPNRAVEALRQAMNIPLLDVDIRNTTRMILSTITSNTGQLTVRENNKVDEHAKQMIGHKVNIMRGVSYICAETEEIVLADDEMMITIIANCGSNNAEEITAFKREVEVEKPVSTTFDENEIPGWLPDIYQKKKQ